MPPPIPAHRATRRTSTRPLMERRVAVRAEATAFGLHLPRGPHRPARRQVRRSAATQGPSGADPASGESRVLARAASFFTPAPSSVRAGPEAANAARRWPRPLSAQPRWAKITSACLCALHASPPSLRQKEKERDQRRHSSASALSWRARRRARRAPSVAGWSRVRPDLPVGAGPEPGLVAAGPEAGPVAAGPEADLVAAGPEAGPAAAGPEPDLVAGPGPGPVAAGPEAGPAAAGRPRGSAPPAAAPRPPARGARAQLPAWTRRGAEWCGPAPCSPVGSTRR
jgi:hypothetical protein